MDTGNPFLRENSKIITELDQDIEKNLSNEYDGHPHYHKWIPLYFKYKNKVSPSYLQFKIYDVLYDEETYIFEKYLLNILKNYKRILDFGCGTCKIWRNNNKFIRKHKIHCIDLDANVLAYPKHILQNYNIKLTTENLCDLNMAKYNCVLFSEVIMQIDNFESMIKYMVDSNPDITIIVNHTIFSPIVSDIITPFKNGIMKYIPILKTSYGRALTYDQTVNMFTNSGCTLVYEKKVFENKIIFVFQKY